MRRGNTGGCRSHSLLSLLSLGLLLCQLGNDLVTRTVQGDGASVHDHDPVKPRQNIRAVGNDEYCGT